MPDKNSLKRDLLSLTPIDFFLKYIAKSHNWYFSEYLHTPQDQLIDKMDLLKEIVSRNLKIGFHSLQIVGSAKTGFSLSPTHILKPFHDAAADTKSSDIDIAVISDRLYTFWWKILRETSNAYFVSSYQQVTSSVFRGFINEKDIMNISTIRQKWNEQISPINKTLQDELQFVHPISYRIYRSWEDLEEYQLKSITTAQTKLEI